MDFFRALAKVQLSNALANRIQKKNELQKHVAGFHGLEYNCINKLLLTTNLRGSMLFGEFHE